jgi:hypothetical protein
MVSKKYEGYCLRCYIYTFPDKPVSRNYKTKEFAVVEYIKRVFANLDWTADKRVVGGCSKRRPDISVDLGYQILIIEIDENQHTLYDCSCENKRIMELSRDYGHRPIVFIRFNPDKYKNNGKMIPSSWGYTQNGICVVKRKKDWQTRLAALGETIQYWTDPKNITNKLIEVTQLYYDIED